MYSAVRARYADDAATTVSPARLLTMLVDKLVADLTAARAAMQRGDVELVGTTLGRSQEILLELAGSLDLSVWPQGRQLQDLYLWMVGELWTARVRQDVDRVSQVLALAEPLRDAWQLAAAETAQAAARTGAVPSPEPGGASDPDAPGSTDARA